MWGQLLVFKMLPMEEVTDILEELYVYIFLKVRLAIHPY